MALCDGYSGCRPEIFRAGIQIAVKCGVDQRVHVRLIAMANNPPESFPEIFETFPIIFGRRLSMRFHYAYWHFAHSEDLPHAVTRAETRPRKSKDFLGRDGILLAEAGLCGVGKMTAFFLRLPNVIERTGLSRSALYRAIRNKSFPSQIHLGVRTVAWAMDDIERWEAERIAASKSIKTATGLEAAEINEGQK